MLPERARAQAHDAPHILLAEDCGVESYASGLRHYSNKRVTTAVDGREALALATSQAFDLWALNYRMPHLKGVEVLSRLRRMGHMTPAIVFSAWTPDEITESIDGLAIADWLEKPFSMKYVNQKIDAALAARRPANNP